jgi:hypothetical protein
MASSSKGLADETGRGEHTWCVPWGLNPYMRRSLWRVGGWQGSEQCLRARRCRCSRRGKQLPFGGSMRELIRGDHVRGRRQAVQAFPEEFLGSNLLALALDQANEDGYVQRRDHKTRSARWHRRLEPRFRILVMCGVVE